MRISPAASFAADAIANAIDSQLIQGAIDAETKPLVQALRAALMAMEYSVAKGCTDHLGACDDGGNFWHDAMDDGKAALAHYENKE